MKTKEIIKAEEGTSILIQTTVIVIRRIDALFKNQSIIIGNVTAQIHTQTSWLKALGQATESRPPKEHVLSHHHKKPPPPPPPPPPPLGLQSFQVEELSNEPS